MFSNCVNVGKCILDFQVSYKSIKKDVIEEQTPSLSYKCPMVALIKKSEI